MVFVFVLSTGGIPVWKLIFMIIIPSVTRVMDPGVHVSMSAETDLLYRDHCHHNISRGSTPGPLGPTCSSGHSHIASIVWIVFCCLKLELNCSQDDFPLNLNTILSHWTNKLAWVVIWCNLVSQVLKTKLLTLTMSVFSRQKVWKIDVHLLAVYHSIILVQQQQKPRFDFLSWCLTFYSKYWTLFLSAVA